MKVLVLVFEFGIDDLVFSDEDNVVVDEFMYIFDCEEVGQFIGLKFIVLDFMI